MLLQDHGPVAAGRAMAAAVDSAVELEEVSALVLALGGGERRLLTAEGIRVLTDTYGTPWDG